MRTVLAATLAAILITPTSSAANPLSFFVSGGELEVEFGLISFNVSDALRDDQFSEIGTANLVSGPLLNLQVDDVNGLTTYSYGAGTLALSLTVNDEHGNPVQGTFLGSTLPFSFVVCEGCDQLFGGGTADDFEIVLGNGVFDGPIANALGVLPNTSGGFIDFGLEDINGDPDSPSRTGFDHRGYAVLEIDAAEVPEPGMLVLGLVAAAGWAAARKRARGHSALGHLEATTRVRSRRGEALD
jgi:hypothetical protein